MTPAKRTPEVIWNELEKEALEDERVARAATMKPEDAARRLADAGFDVEAERAEARAFQEQLAQRVAARRAVSKRLADAKRRPQRRVVVWLAAAAVAAAAGGGLLYARLSHRPLPAPVPPIPSLRAPGPEPSTSGPPLIAAEDLRQHAFAHCAASEWRECLESFDAAAHIDPQGDAAPAVQEARRKAEAEIKANPPWGRKLN
jgi:hypothetical protein